MAGRIAIRNRLMSSGMDDATAERWCDAWELEAAGLGLPRNGGYWQVGAEWIDVAGVYAMFDGSRPNEPREGRGGRAPDGQPPGERGTVACSVPTIVASASDQRSRTLHRPCQIPDTAAPTPRSGW